MLVNYALAALHLEAQGFSRFNTREFTPKTERDWAALQQIALQEYLAVCGRRVPCRKCRKPHDPSRPDTMPYGVLPTDVAQAASVLGRWMNRTYGSHVKLQIRGEKWVLSDKMGGEVTLGWATPPGPSTCVASTKEP